MEYHARGVSSTQLHRIRVQPCLAAIFQRKIRRVDILDHKSKGPSIDFDQTGWLASGHRPSSILSTSPASALIKRFKMAVVYMSSEKKSVPEITYSAINRRYFNCCCGKTGWVILDLDFHNCIHPIKLCSQIRVPIGG